MVKSGIEEYYKSISEYGVLTVEEEVTLFELGKMGDVEALDELVNCNLRLVMKIAHDFKGEGVPLMDLIQEGNIGLIVASKKFDPEKGKFSTYASWWIKRYMRNSVYKQSSFNMIEIPQYIASRIAKLKRLSEDVDGTESEVLNHLVENSGFSKKMIVKDLQSEKAKYPCSTEDIKEKIGLEICGKTNVINDICDKEHYGIINSIIDDLGERDRGVISLRYGLDGAVPKSLKEVGNHYGLTPERIRQIQKDTIRKIRISFDEEVASESF